MITPAYLGILIRSFLAAVTFATVYFINPFGIRTASVEYSENVFIRLRSPWYGQEGESEITIILLDDRYIKESGQHYPAKYSQLRHLFKVINAHQPSAVFFDIFQQYEHSAGLRGWLNILRKAQFPVFMASLPWIDTPEELATEQSLRHKLAQVTRLTSVGWEGEQYAHYYPLRMKSPYYTGPDGASQPFLSTVALDLYRIWCQDNGDKCTVKKEQLDDSASFRTPMVVRWSSRAAPGQAEGLQLRKPCQQVLTDKWDELWNGFKLEFLRPFPWYEATVETSRKTCFHIPTLSAESLRQQGCIDPKEPNGQMLSRMLNGKIVLVGYYLESSSDLVKSPLHGTMAGVFYHAMALDNLINYGTGYWHSPPSVIGTISLSDLFEGVLHSVALGWVCHFKGWHRALAYRRKKVVQDGERYSRYSKRAGVLALILLIISLGGCFFFNLGVTNLLALTLTVGMVIQALVVVLIQKLRHWVQSILNSKPKEIS